MQTTETAFERTHMVDFTDKDLKAAITNKLSSQM